eukprot:gene14596-19602_t
MMILCSIFVLVVSLLNFCYTVNGAVNKEVTRTIDASTAVVRITTDVKVANVEKEYKIIFTTEMAAKLAFLSVSHKGKVLSYTAPISAGNFSIYSVKVPESNPTLKILSVFTSSLEPYPAEIAQNENQLVRLRDSHYFYSPYKTETQKTTIKLASSSVESFTKLSPFTTKGSSLQFGSYKNIEPFEYSPLIVHYVNNFPFAKFSTMTKELEVSHWGNIAVEEIYELKHAGAVLKGGFSRFDYQARRSAQSPSFRNLIAVLPGQANNIYYRDQIGNISTSDIRIDDGDIELDIQTRFPIFGGWQTQFYLGYSIPTKIALYLEENRYNLKFDFFTPFENVWVDEMEIKVILPEGCTDIKVDVPYPVEQSRTTRYTYLDAELNGGRPVLIIRAKNLVEEHDFQVHVSYNFNTTRMLVEPLMLVGSFFALFLLYTFFSYTSSKRTIAAPVVSKSDKSD